MREKALLEGLKRQQGNVKNLTQYFFDLLLTRNAARGIMVTIDSALVAAL